MTIKLLQDYGGFKAGYLCDTANDEDAQVLIKAGIAEKHIPIFAADIKDELVAELVKAELAKEEKTTKIPAQPKENKAPWKCFGQFAQAVVRGEKDNVLCNYEAESKATGMSEGINVDGGFLIPPEFSTGLLTAMSEQAVIYPRCMNLPVNNGIEMPFVNITSQATSWTGGVTIYKPAEAIQKTASSPKLAHLEMKLQKMIALIYATDELISDSPIALQTFLSALVSTELALTRDEDIINGSGAGEALGIVGAPCTVSVAKETGQAAATIEYANVAKMWSRLNNTSRSNAIWLINQDCMKEISALNIAVGTGGAPVMVVNAASQMPQSLFGAPIVWSPHCQTLGTSGDIILGDFSQYVGINKAGRTIDAQTSIHLKFDYDETAFRFVMRYNGQPWWAQARTPKHGSNTISPFVKLATRA